MGFYSPRRNELYCQAPIFCTTVNVRPGFTRGLKSLRDSNLDEVVSRHFAHPSAPEKMDDADATEVATAAEDFVRTVRTVTNEQPCLI